MAEISNELIYEVLKKVQADVADIKTDLRSLQTQVIAVQGQVGGLQTQVASIASDLLQTKERVERIERRLDLRESADA